MNRLRDIIFICSFWVFQLVYGQCPLINLTNDLVDASEDFKSIVNTNTGFDAYRVLGLAEETKEIRVGKEALEDVSQYLSSNSKSADKLAKEIKDAGGYTTWKVANTVDEFLEGFVGVVRRGNADEIADATTRIANHRTAINKPSSGNFGYVEGNINGNSVNSKLWSSGSADPITEPQIFDATEVGGWIRNTDSEYKMLNKLADDLGGVKGSSYPNVSGEIKIASERAYWTSCQGVLQQFSEMYPNLKLILVDGVR